MRAAEEPAGAGAVVASVMAGEASVVMEGDSPGAAGEDPSAGTSGAGGLRVAGFLPASPLASVSGVSSVAGGAGGVGGLTGASVSPSTQVQGVVVIPVMSLQTNSLMLFEQVSVQVVFCSAQNLAKGRSCKDGWKLGENKERKCMVRW